jgi:hypothetical protein
VPDVRRWLVREVDGVPCLQREDFDAAAASLPVPGQTFTFVCGAGCGGRLMFVDYLPVRRVLALRCGNCAATASQPIIPEAASSAGGEIPIASPQSPRGLAS